MHAVPVALTGTQPWNVPVVNKSGGLSKGQACLGIAVIEQAQLDLVSDLGEDREVDAGAVKRGAQRVWLTGPNREARGGIRAAGRSRVERRLLISQVTTPLSIMG